MTLFRKPNAFYLHKPFFSVLKRRPFLQTKSFSFVQAFPYCHPKQPFSALRFPFPPSHNLLSTKEHGYSFVVRSNSLRCKTRTSHRFKAFSPPSCAKNRFRHVSSENFAEIFFDRALNRPRESRGSQPFGVLPVLFVQAKRIKPFPLPGTSRFSKPRFSSPQLRLRTNKIKTLSKRCFEVLQTSNFQTNLVILRRSPPSRIYIQLHQSPEKPGRRPLFPDVFLVIL